MGMNRRQFLKIAGVVVGSVPVLGTIKEAVAPGEKKVPECCPHKKAKTDAVVAQLLVNGDFYKTVMFSYPMYVYHEAVHEPVSLRLWSGDCPVDLDPVGHIARFDLLRVKVQERYGIEVRIATYDCPDPQYFVRSDGELCKHGVSA